MVWMCDMCNGVFVWRVCETCVSVTVYVSDVCNGLCDLCNTVCVIVEKLIHHI